MAKDIMTVKAHTARLSEFAKDMVRGLDRDGADAMIRKLAFDLLALIIGHTPVDTGRARSGWTAFADEVGVPYRIDGPNVTADAIATGKGESDFQIVRNVNGTMVVITNGVPYIIALEYGHSKKAPAGMVRLSIRQLLLQDDAKDITEDVLKDAIIKADKATKHLKGK